MAESWHQVRVSIACETVWIPQPMKRHPGLLNELHALPVRTPISCLMRIWPPGVSQGAREADGAVVLTVKGRVRC
jgi:hypothetical protein